MSGEEVTVELAAFLEGEIRSIETELSFNPSLRPHYKDRLRLIKLAAERLRALERERASLVADADASQHWQTRALRAEAQVEKLRADSERPEWLAEIVDSGHVITFVRDWGFEVWSASYFDHSEVDERLGHARKITEAIDAARHRDQAQGGGEG